MKVEAKSKSASIRAVILSEHSESKDLRFQMLYVPLTMLTLRANRRSFDCASRDEAARDFAQDDSVLGRQNFW